ncbi:hypothetical protein R3W88_011732 [Solanum pinnatisectum]|uniref:RNase H type-1 domain-containing protein n=1 Tax=Solanum pinnatisectum TaxID=50273 RepID=A0AAV9L859_9SOLN|nr:hypothetical protein R3W88_011732 [Solanum pinnatisectum]
MFCCNNNVQETFEYLFIECPNTYHTWGLFKEAAGLHFQVVRIKQILEEWWKADCPTKLKPIFKAVPACIIWQIWKRRNVIKHGGSMSRQSMILEIHRNVYLFTKYKYPWLKDIPNSWPHIVKFLENYTPLIQTKIVRWLHPPWGNSRSMAFCIRNEEGKMIYAESRVMENVSVIEVEIKAIRMGIEYCIEHDLVPLIIETDSLMAQKILCGIWEVPCRYLRM